MLGSSATSLRPKRRRKSFVVLVKDGAADDLLAAGGGDELARDEAAEDAAGIYAADFGDFGRGDWLLVGDDGEGFKGLQGELQHVA